MNDRLRVVKLRPYRPGLGPIWTLTLWDTHRVDRLGKSILRYRLTENCPIDGKTVLFEGEDFACSPMHAVDSDYAVAAVLGFLTLRPGDTDAEYFESYTPRQLEFCAQHAEYLQSYITDRFGEW